MLNNHAEYKNEIPYQGQFVITQCFPHGTVRLQYGPTKSRYNICWIKPYKTDTNVEDINTKNMYDDVNI